LGVAHHVGNYDAEIQGEEERDLVTPAKGEVRPSMDEEDGVDGLSLWFGEEVAVCDAIEVGGLELDPRIVGGDFVDHCEVNDQQGIWALY